MSIEKKKDDELFSLIWIAVIFGGLVAGVSIRYSAWSEMGPVWGTVGAICLIIDALLLFVVFAKRDDPDYDKYRVWFCVVAVLTTLFIGGFRFSRNETQSVIDDSNANKQEQLK